jgi:hypothetical protein
MKTITEVYQESLDKINKEPVVTAIGKEIQIVTEALTKTELQNWSPDQLSRALSKLAVLRVNLGAEMADAIAYYDLSYIHRKITYASEWKPTKDKLNKTIQKATIQDIDSVIQEKMADVNYQELQNKHYAERLRILYDATETLITALQSRIGVLKQERNEARFNN